MSIKKGIFVACTGLLLAMVVSPIRINAQQITGTTGAPRATTTTGGKLLRLPDPSFGGAIKEKASDSTP